MSRLPNSVEYTVNVTTGRSTANVRNLADALRSLGTQITRTQTATSGATPFGQAYATSLQNLTNVLNGLRGMLPQLAQAAVRANNTITQSVNGVNQAISNTQRNMSSWQRGMQVLMHQQNPWNRGMAVLGEQRGAAAARRAAGAQAWQTGMQNLAGQQAAANGPWQRGMANLMNQRFQGQMAGLSARYMAQQQQYATAAQNITNRMNAAQAATQRTQVSMQGLAFVTAQVANLFGTARIIGFAEEVTLLAGRVQNLDTVMQAVATTNNIAAGEMYTLQDGLKRLGITTQVSREILTRFAQNNLRMADSLKIARIAQDAAVVAGLNSSDTAERMMIAVQRLDTRMLRNIGILVNLRNEYQKVAIATGRYENSLTANEKQQIVMNAVIRAGAALNGTYEQSLNDVYKQWTSLDRKIEEAKRRIGEQFLPIFQLLVDAMDSVTEALGYGNEAWAKFAAILTGGGVGFGVGVALIGIGALLAMLQPELLLLGLVVTSVTAALGMLGAAISSDINLARQQDRILKEQAERYAYQALTANNLADEIERLTELKKQGLTTEEEEIDLINKKQEAQALFNESKDKEKRQGLNNASDQDFAAKLRQYGTGSENKKTTEDIIRAKKNERDAAIAEIRPEVREEAARKGIPLEQVSTKVAQLTRELNALEKAADRIELKKLDELETQLDNLDRVAREAKKALREIGMEGMSESAKGILKNIDLLNELSAVSMSKNQIDRQFDLAKRESERQLATNKEETRKKGEEAGKDEKAIQAELNDLDAKHAIAVAGFAQRRKEELEKVKELEDSINKIRAHNAQLEADMKTGHARESDMYQYRIEGIENFGAKLRDLVELHIQYHKASHAMDDAIEEQQKKIKDLTDEINKGNFAQGDDLAAAQKRLASYQEQLKALQNLAGDALPTYIEKLKIAKQAAMEAMGAMPKQMQELRIATEALRVANDMLANGMESSLAGAFEKSFNDVAKHRVEIDKLNDAINSVNSRTAQINNKPNITGEEREELIQLMSLWKALHDRRDALEAEFAQQVRKNIADMVKAQKDAVKELTQDAKQLALENELAAQKIDSGVASALAKASEEADKFSEEMKKVDDNIAAIEARKNEIVTDEDGLKILEQLEAAEQSLLDKKAAMDIKRIEQEKKTQDELIKVQQDAVKKQTDIAQAAMDKKKEILKELKNATGTTMESLFKEQLEIRKMRGDPLAEPIEGIMSDFQRFRGIMQGAGKEDQLHQTVNTFRELMLQKAGGWQGIKALPPELIAALNTADAQLQQVAGDRKAELVQKFAEIRNQEIIRDEALKQTALLGGILNKMMGGKPGDAAMNVLHPPDDADLKRQRRAANRLGIPDGAAPRFPAPWEAGAQIKMQHQPFGAKISRAMVRALREHDIAQKELNRIAENALDGIIDSSAAGVKHTNALQRKLSRTEKEIQRIMRSRHLE